MRTRRSIERRTWVALVPLTVASLVVGLTLVGVTGQKAIRSEPLRDVSAALSHVLPQGWSFFTKAPQTPRYRLYSQDDGQLVDEMARFSVDHTTLYGWNRSYRNVAAERELVERVLTEAELHDCSSGEIVECFSALDITAPEYSVATFTKTPELCGTFFVSVGEPVPWAWKHLVDGDVRVTGVTTLEISC